jgi:hypothetical protein
MDDGFQFNIDPEDIILTVSLRQRLLMDTVHVRRIVVKRGEGLWEVDAQNVGGIFRFSFS